MVKLVGRVSSKTRLMLMELQTSQADHLSASLVNAETL